MNNHWGGSLEINGGDSTNDNERSRNMDWDRASVSHQGDNHDHLLDETQQSWLLGPSDNKKKKKYVDLGCIVCSRDALKWTTGSIFVAFIVIGLPIIVAKSLPKHKPRPPSPDNYTIALRKALLFFNAQKCKVGGSQNGSRTPDDHYCWQRPEVMSYHRPVQTTTSAPELAAEMAAAMSAAFRDNPTYSKKLIRGAETVFDFARDPGKRVAYCSGNPYIEPYYNSTGYFDEHMWGAAWLFYATGNKSYLSLATNPSIAENAKAFCRMPDSIVLSWDNKLPAAMLVLTRIRLFLSPGYPYEDMLRSYHNVTELTMCSYLKRYNVFNWTRGGMIILNHGRAENLQYVANAAFLASVFADYLNATGVPGWNCGPEFFRLRVLKEFTTSQMNSLNMSYVVSHGHKYPRQVHHRGTSIAKDGTKYSCTSGWRWRDAKAPNPNTISGAMVGGPDQFDNFRDIRTNYSYTEATVAGNAGPVAALVSLTSSSHGGIDKNTIFSAIPPLYPRNPPPPPPWRP
ncbi:hypothetical protein OROGR_002257 [Orobanche gracilis]